VCNFLASSPGQDSRAAEPGFDLHRHFTYEPFGLAPLEAALSRCAIVANDIPSLREVWGSAAMYF